jgi:uncharacterized protein YdaU (DUF1376 family)
MARPWYAFYPADYGRDTGHLSLVEHGAYRALMDHYYASAAPLPMDEGRLLRLCRAKAPREQAAVRYVLATFFQAREDGWHHGRIDAEIAKAEDLTAKCSFAARVGQAKRKGEANASANAGANAGANVSANVSAGAPADGQPSQSQSQSQEKYIPFEDFWSAYPKRQARGAAVKAWGKALAKAAPEILIAAASGYAARRAGQDAQFTKLPATWLTQECWLDDAPLPPITGAVEDAALAWAGLAAPLVAEIGPASFQAYFAAADFAPGPPAQIRVSAPFLRDLIERKFSHSIRRAYGEFALETYP